MSEAEQTRFQPNVSWTKHEFGADDAPSDDQLQQWIVESDRLLVPRKIARRLGSSIRRCRCSADQLVVLAATS